MLKILVPAILLCTSAFPALAGSDQGPASVVAAFMSAFNKGEMKALAATCSADTAIIDEFPPFEWRGANSCTVWARDAAKYFAKSGITNAVVILGKPKHADIIGDRAYVVFPANFEYKLKGKPMKEIGAVMTAFLTKSNGQWRIASWAWARA